MRNFWKTNKKRYAYPGCMGAEQFDLLIDISAIHSEKVIRALRDYYVTGLEPKDACKKNKVSMSYFSVSRNKLMLLNSLVASVARYYSSVPV